MIAVEGTRGLLLPSNMNHNWTGQSLSHGDNNKYVKQLQNMLNKAGYSVGTADGIFGNKTLQALKNFQKANGLTQDGIAGKNTFNALIRELADPPKATPSTNTGSTTSSRWTGQTLREGSKGQAVKDLQGMLNDLGYNAGKEDGIYGNQTEESVRKFQRSVGLSADGIAGTYTYRGLTSKLEEANRKKVIYDNPRPKIQNQEINFEKVLENTLQNSYGPLKIKIEQQLDLGMDITFSSNMKVTQSKNTMKFQTSNGDTLLINFDKMMSAKFNDKILYERSFQDTVKYGGTTFESKYSVLADALVPDRLESDGYYRMATSSHSLKQEVDFEKILGLSNKKGFEDLKISFKMELKQEFKVNKGYYDSMEAVFIAAAGTGKIAQKGLEKFTDIIGDALKSPKLSF